MATLNEKQAALFTDRNWGVIATIRETDRRKPRRRIDYDGENVLVNSARGGRRSTTSSATRGDRHRPTR
jgi:hypothetical protein